MEGGRADLPMGPKMPPWLTFNWVALTVYLAGWAAVACYPRTRILAEVFLLALPALLVYNLPYLVFAPLLGIRVEEIGVGFGWQLLRLRIGGAAIRLNALPLGTYVKYPSGEGQYDVDGRPMVGTFGALHPLTRLWFVLSGPMACAVLGILLQGVQGPRSFGITFQQLFGLFYLDLKIPAGWIGEFFRAGLRGEWQMVIGVLALKIGVVNLTPLGGCPGGTAVLSLIEWFTGRKRHGRFEMMFLYLGLLVLLVLFVRLALAVARALGTL